MEDTNHLLSTVLHNIEAEQALLGAVILDNDLLERIPDYFVSESFSSPLNAKIFNTIKKIRDLGSVADPITITAYLTQDDMFVKSDGQKYIIDLADAVIGLSGIADYAGIIHDLHLRRQIMNIGDEIASRAKNMVEEETTNGLIEDAEKKLYNIANGIGDNNRLFAFSDALASSIEAAASAYKRDTHIVGVTTGFKALDKWLGGMHKSDLIVVAGRPSMGKTAFATNIAFNAAKQKLKNFQDGTAVVFFSLEMSAEQLATRILSSESGISSDSIRRGEIPKDSFDKFLTISRELESIELFIDDTPNITVGQIRSRVRRLKRKYNIGLIVIDYLQLVESGGRRNSDNRVNEISEITRALKGLAKEMNVPVVALSQLSRAVEQREDKKPQLSDLRESGSIEQDSDVVMFVFREEYYKARKEPQEGTIEHDKWQLEMEKIYNRAEIIIAKQRHGPVGSIKLFFDGRLTKFGNLMD
ncbi:MAG: replicative DNA helicase [Holosporales bacterium]|jgi:replicative DNA helicase|nr:replicative DNA helicase [Holosporales bacterium]